MNEDEGYESDQLSGCRQPEQPVDANGANEYSAQRRSGYPGPGHRDGVESNGVAQSLLVDHASYHGLVTGAPEGLNGAAGHGRYDEIPPLEGPQGYQERHNRPEYDKQALRPEQKLLAVDSVGYDAANQGHEEHRP